MLRGGKTGKIYPPGWKLYPGRLPGYPRRAYYILQQHIHLRKNGRLIKAGKQNHLPVLHYYPHIHTPNKNERYLHRNAAQLLRGRPSGARRLHCFAVKRGLITIHKHNLRPSPPKNAHDLHMNAVQILRGCPRTFRHILHVVIHHGHA